MNIGYIHTKNPSDTSFFYQEKALLQLHCDHILLDEGNNLSGLLHAIEACNWDDHLFCLPLEQLISSSEIRDRIHRLMSAKRIDMTSIA